MLSIIKFDFLEQTGLIDSLFETKEDDFDHNGEPLIM
jgi:hypothetical protein